MRIVAGIYGGRTLISPKTRDTRPMTDKVRAALFDMLGPLDGYSVLDAYAGTGALGFEALSRGAERVEAIEVGGQAAAAIKENVRALQVDFQYSLHKTTVEKWLAQSPAQQYDLIFAMPPYAILDPGILERCAALLNPDGIMVVEYPRQYTERAVTGLEIIQERSYGDPTLVFYRATKP